MDVIAIDLGKRVSGLAVFRDDVLLRAMEVKCRAGTVGGMAATIYGAALGLEVDVLLGTWHAEKMLDYQGKGRRCADLQHLREIGDHLEQRFAVDLHLKAAHRWKGGIPKSVTMLRIMGQEAVRTTTVRRSARLGLLTPAEKARVNPVSKETIDAIGLGLFVLGRARRGMLPP